MCSSASKCGGYPVRGTNIGATTPSVYFFFDFLKGEVLPKCDSTRRRRIAKKIVNVLFTNMKCSFIGGLFSTVDQGSR